MAAPNTSAPLQARTEMLSCITTLLATLREQLELQDVQMLLRWLDAFARCPVGVGEGGGGGQC